VRPRRFPNATIHLREQSDSDYDTMAENDYDTDAYMPNTAFLRRHYLHYFDHDKQSIGATVSDNEMDTEDDEKCLADVMQLGILRGWHRQAGADTDAQPADAAAVVDGASSAVTGLGALVAASAAQPIAPTSVNGSEDAPVSAIDIDVIPEPSVKLDPAGAANHEDLGAKAELVATEGTKSESMAASFKTVPRRLRLYLLGECRFLKAMWQMS